MPRRAPSSCSPHFEIGLLERAERVVMLAAGALFGLIVAALWIIAIGSAITAAQRSRSPTARCSA